MPAKTPEIAVTILAGVSGCGGGFVMVNGKLIKIPPRGPVFDRVSKAYGEILAALNVNAVAKEG